MKIAIVDYGLANIRSIINAIECFNVDVYLAEHGDQLFEADRIILPGVGSFDAGMKGLHERGFVEVLNQSVFQQGKPCLGICLGFQFLFEGSEEGDELGLNWIKGSARKFNRSNLKVPHIGWNEVVARDDSILFVGLESRFDVYFVHSYYIPYEAEAADNCIGFCDYGQKYVVALEKDNIFGLQFHPEKSQLTGMKILENFINYTHE